MPSPAYSLYVDSSVGCDRTVDDAPGPQPGAHRDLTVTAGSIPCTSAAFAELSTEMLRAGKALRFRARGASMDPLLRDGDVLLVEPLQPGSARIGDVVLCGAEPGRVVVHRVIRKRAGPGASRFTVQGDQVARPDGDLPAEQIYGRVAAIERNGAHIDMERPLISMLGRLAALRSRWCPDSRWCRRAGRLAARLPVLSRYLG